MSRIQRLRFVPIGEMESLLTAQPQKRETTRRAPVAGWGDTGMPKESTVRLRRLWAALEHESYRVEGERRDTVDRGTGCAT